MVDTYDGFITLHVPSKGDPETRPYIIKEAPGRITVDLRGYTRSTWIELEGTLTFTVANGVVVYRIDAVDPHGNLMCTKAVDELIEFTPPERGA